ncbi:MAG: Crp/Fnr family transcriptional regulator [Saprospiraceae bacterium]|nr:Crp/Fnr family transcriptional regulator [Saprospiraceae bacterium]MBX7176562.1 Crp/Fnr family transcriptional regulator [Saprospiraceae bacterium]HMW39018.1 Crp/Fnr family transcriptional regulator [Saprospiraceae bacterium]HMX87043.1 Crp/Fnr family transcriptional regulator [Saprospiraceae bacterium]HMZ41244.1 Crp/Fnr family transcriptional regulator [Saprospiraceae bacterium]
MNFPEIYRSTFEPALIQAILANGRFLQVKEGEVIIDIGQTVRTIPLLISGILKVTRENEEGREILLYYVTASESCAMTFTCCMQQYPSEIRATAETESELLAIPIGVMDEWLVKYPTWKSFVMRTIRNRFNELLQTIDQLAFQKLDERLVVYLKEKSRITGSSLVNLSHEEIAQELASSRVVISRLLKKLEEDKKVLLYRNQIKLLKGL